MKITHLLALATFAAGSALAQSVIQFGSVTASVNEAGPNVTVTVTRTGSTTAAQSVNYMTANGTAAAPADFVQTSGTLAFAAGETSKTITIGPTVVPAPYVRIMNDTLVEGPETFTLSLSRPIGGATLGAPSTLTVTIVSDENGVSMGAATRSFAEGAGAQTIDVSRSGSTGAVDVNYTFTDGTATNGVNFGGSLGSLHWNDGESGVKTIPVFIGNDAGVNANRTFTVLLTSATGATLVAPMSTGVTITDNDNTVQFNLPTATVTEGTANLMLSVTRTGVITQPADVTWTTADGSALAGTDFGVAGITTPSTGTLHWNAGVGTPQTITLPILNDNLLEGAKTFTVNLSAPVGANLSLGANPVATVTLNDNDKGVQFQNATYEIFENAVPATLTVQVARVGPANMAITATWATVNGTAESGKDFGILNNLVPRTGTLSWGVNDMAPKPITIPILQDAISEGDETFTITLTPGAGVVLGTPGVATVTIKDDDIPPESAFTFAQPKYVVSEGAGNVVLTIDRVDLGGGLNRAVSVKYSTTPGTALAPADYTTATNVVVNFAALEAAKTISIPIANNAVAEPPKTFKVVLSAASPGASIGAQPDSTVLILDDDEAFPRAGVMPPGFSKPATSTSDWVVSNDPGAYEGAYSLKSQEIDDNQTAGLQMSGNFAAGSVRFYVKLSTEPGYDLLQFFIDDVFQTSWSGTAVTTWQLSPTYTLGAGVHTLKWVYTKDGSVAMGSDAVWLDGLVTPAFNP